MSRQHRRRGEAAGPVAKTAGPPFPFNGAAATNLRNYRAPERGHSCPQQRPNASHASPILTRLRVWSLLRTGMSALRPQLPITSLRTSVCVGD